MGCPGGFGYDCDCDCAWRREVHTPRFATAATNPFALAESQHLTRGPAGPPVSSTHVAGRIRLWP